MSAWQTEGGRLRCRRGGCRYFDRGGGGNSWEDDGVDGQEMEVGNGRVEL
jgi:hypothetical protein